MYQDPQQAVSDQNTGITNQTTEQKPEEKPALSLQVSADNLTAYLRVKTSYSGQTVLYEDVIAFLEQNNITYGISDEYIHTYCDEGKYFKELICAKGLPPEDGEDGTIEYFFNTEKELKPKEREDGTVDFRDLGLVKNVSKGDVLCTITPPGEGKDGADVFGAPILCKPGRLPVLPFGSNTVVSEDGLSLIADADGCIEHLKDRININDVFIVRGSVNTASGNVHVNGSVIVQGDVLEGFSVISGQDITVRGMVEGATLEAKGNISLSNGMNGMGRGILKAGGNIVGKYFENATLQTDSDVYTDVLMNCNVTAGGSIILKGRKASLIGGSCEVSQRVVSKYIGTMNHTATKISVQSKLLSSILVVGDEADTYQALQQKLAQKEEELQEFQEQYTKLMQQISENGQMNSERGKLLIKSSVLKKSKMVESLEQLKSKVSNMEKEMANLIDFHIIGSGITYPGTKIVIGPFTYNVHNECSNTKFHADQNGVVLGPVLPSDKLD